MVQAIMVLGTNGDDSNESPSVFVSPFEDLQHDQQGVFKSYLAGKITHNSVACLNLEANLSKSVTGNSNSFQRGFPELCQVLNGRLESLTCR
jgi:TolB-like protein